MEFFKREFPQCFFSSPQLHFNSHVIPLFKKFLNLFCAKLKVVLSRAKSEPNALRFYLFYLFLLFPFVSFVFIFKLSEIGNLAYRRKSSRRDFNKRESPFLRNAQRLGCVKNAEVFPRFVNDANGRNSNLVVYAIPFLDGCLVKSIMYFFKTISKLHFHFLVSLAALQKYFATLSVALIYICFVVDKFEGSSEEYIHNT